MAEILDKDGRPMVIGKTSGNLREGDQVPGMRGAICHACGLGYKCLDEDCPNEKPNPMFDTGPDDIVGHKTFDTGELCPETGFPKLRHEPLTRAEADAIWSAAEAAKAKRAVDMPDERAALNAMFQAWSRLKELGWREAMYCPKDGSAFKVIEAGSTGIFDCHYQGEWASGHFLIADGGDLWPSHPILFKLLPEDQAKYDAKMAEAKAKYAAG